jgi:phage terminase Nu1 subunit (DNA packaging protein)
MPSTGGVKVGSSYDEARTRKVNAEAEIAELELARVHGTLVLAADVVQAWEDVLGALKGKLLSIPTKAAPVVSAEPL